MTKVFDLLVYYSYIFVFFKLIEKEAIKYFRINKGKYKNIKGVVTNINNTARTINGEYRYFITYTIAYEVDGKEYSFEYDKMWYEKKRNVGETISLMFDIDNPRNYHVIGDHKIIIFFLPFILYILYMFINYLIK